VSDLAGLKLTQSHYLATTRTVNRTWRERLFSWPWRPWLATRIERIPDPSLYQLGGDTLVGHPATIERLRRATKGARE
jgi:hypothetical protein